MKVAVVGGGISGLTVAFLLARAGRDVVVFEAGRPGGLMHSQRLQGFLCEAGPQAILDGAPEVRALIAAARLEERVVTPHPAARRRFVYLRGRLRPVPSGPLSLLGSDLLSLGGKWRLAHEPRVPARRDGADESVLDFATRRVGPEVARSLVAPAVIGIFAGDAARLSLRSAFPRLAAMEAEQGSLLRGLRAARRGGATAAPGRSISFRDGIDELPRTLAAGLAERLVQTRITGIARDGAGWHLGGAPGVYDKVILALPPRAAASLLGALAPRAAEVLQGLTLASVAVVALGFRSADIGMRMDGYGFLVARGEGRTLLGCQYESAVFPGRAPEGGALLRVIMGGTFHPGVVTEEEPALVARAIDELGTIAGLRARPDVTATWRLPDVLPQYELGHEERARVAEEDLVRLRGLHLLGTGLRGTGLTDCIRNATTLAGWLG